MNDINALVNNNAYPSFSKNVLTQVKDGVDEDAFILLAKQSDLADIVNIYNEELTSKTATADLEMVTVADKQAWFDEHINNPKRPIYVVKNRGGEVMAWGSFSDYKNRIAFHISSEISIYVSNDFRRRKLASLLLSWMIEQADHLGIYNIVALIFAHNHSSLNLFTKFDFDVWGKLPEFCDMDGFYADLVIMGKKV